MPNVLVLQHVACETAGTIADALARRGVSHRVVRSHTGEEVPESFREDEKGLVVMGGPMAVYESERYPFIRKEMRLIELALKSGRPVLGVCLGSQLLASVLGAPVIPAKHKEIGWFPVKLTPDGIADPLFEAVRSGFYGFHWHGDVFALPKGAVRLAGSELTEVQAYRYGRGAYGMLFHMEVTEPMVREWVRDFGGELDTAGIPPQPILDGIAARLPALKQIGTRVFDRWADLVQSAKAASAQAA